MNNKKGFTLIEVAIVMVILGIMAALTLIKYNKTVSANELQKTANNMYTEVRSLRSQALKWDAMVITKFTATKCSTWVDTNGNLARDAADIRFVIKLPATIAIGLPTSPPINGPYGGSIPASGLGGQWADSLTTFPDSKIDTCDGELYLYCVKLPKITYCIANNAASQAVELYKWDGTWRKL